MRFNSPETRKIYSGRQVDPLWEVWAKQHLSPQGKRVVDIGCGGGIYSLGFSTIGAKSVIGIDQSTQYINDAIEEFSGCDGIRFLVGDALETNLDRKCTDIIFERALIHHFSEEQQKVNALECHRLLRDQGILAVQDRTIEDIHDESPESWIRAALVEAFPRLIEFERKRRPSQSQYTKVLEAAGFSSVTIIPFKEVRKHYQSFEELKQEIMSRKGKSILYELDDQELKHYCEVLEQKSRVNELKECDLWTVWLAKI